MIQLIQLCCVCVHVAADVTPRLLLIILSLHSRAGSLLTSTSAVALSCSFFFLCRLGRHALSAFLPGCWLCSSITPCLLCSSSLPYTPAAYVSPSEVCRPVCFPGCCCCWCIVCLTLQGYTAGIALPRFFFLSLPSHSASLANLSSPAAAEDKTGAGQKDGVSAFNYCIVPFVFFFFKLLKNRAGTTGQREAFSLLHFLPLLILGTECRGGEEGGTRTDF